MSVRVIRRLVVALTSIALVGAGTAPAHAAKKTTAEPSVSSTAYYWEDQQSQEHNTPAGTVVVETPSPFCPASAGSLGSAEELCATEILPVWIKQGDYETPYMLAALNFDLSLVPVGSTVHSFKATFLEDEPDCRDHDDDQQTPPRCRPTEPNNIEGKKLQACVLGQIIGGGDARPYKELPDYKCSPTDPVATRKEVKNDDEKDPDDPDPDHVWTFDLTPLAKDWVKEFSVVTGIVLVGEAPKETGANDDNWHVVLSGPSIPNGVRTKLVYTPAKAPAIPLPPPVGGDVPGGSFSSGGGFGTTTTSGGTGFSTGSGDIGATDGGPTGEAAPEAAPETDLASEEAPPIEGMPGYVWLALLAGLVAFSMVRSVVLERAAGIRPNGALAQIRRLNADRRGGEFAATGASPLAGLAAGVRSLGARGGKMLSGAMGRLTSLGRRR